MQGEIVYRLARRSDVSELTKLINAQYARKKTEAYFIWQYFESCYPTVMMCAYDGNSLVGVFGLQKRMLHNGAIAGQAIDLLVAPDWRGKGIFKELGLRTFRSFPDLDVLCVLPNTNGKMAVEQSFGWTTIGKINSMCKPASQATDSTASSGLSDSNTPVNKDIVRFDYDTTIRKWRFDQNPIYQYEYVKLDNSSFTVTKIFHDPVTQRRHGDIVDFQCPGNEVKTLTELFRIAYLRLLEQKVESVTTWALPGTTLASAVNDLGFTELQRERYFCINVLNTNHEYLYDFSRWHLVQADAEVY